MELSEIRILGTPALTCAHVVHPSKGTRLWYFNEWPHPRLEGVPCEQTMMYHLMVEGSADPSRPVMIEIIDDDGTHRFWGKPLIKYTNATDFFEEINK